MEISCAEHKAIIIQPPLVQLNTAYPSGAYLSAFFKSQNVCSSWHDLSIVLIDRIFCKGGLERLFELTEKKALSLAEGFAKNGEDFAAKNLKQYILQKDLWILWIDSIMKILRDGSKSSSRELTHKFVFSPFVPRGMRMESYLEKLDAMPTADDARNLAGAALEDLADYINVAFDKDFALIRYAESIAVGKKSFGEIEGSLDSPVLKEFYEKVLEQVFCPGGREDTKIMGEAKEGRRCLVCISLPFAGTFTPALFTGRFLKQRYGSKVFISFGGGFINTELRDFDLPEFERYADAISLDRGYGSYRRLLESGILSGKDFYGSGVSTGSRIYKMRLWFSSNGKTVTIAPSEDDGEMATFENSVTKSLVPDYSDIDFSLYPRMADDTNPMQRLWSDGSWIKAYLAHGCYWHKCAFCDVTLDYVCSYKMTDIEHLYSGLLEQAKEKGVYGIHFVDEALPPAGCIRFAKCNLKEGTPLSYWGNVRFEKVYSRDMADFLCFGGLTGVSGGIEIATGNGLDKISKGTDLDSIVSACCAFKEAGILIHAYMIYGYFGESAQDTINSMETLRQFFELGLLDSCFWHKFVLTRHSRIYDEWKHGLYPDLCPTEEEGAGLFAKNGMHFKGEGDSKKFGRGLNLALNSWMHGEKLGMNVCKWFDFKTPMPTVAHDLVQKAVEKYELRRNAEWKSPLNIKRCLWLSSRPLVCKNKLEWQYMQENHSLALPSGADSKSVNEFLLAMEGISAKIQQTKPMEDFVKKRPDFLPLLQKMRGKGLVQV
ncbi:MAG: radical SAM protein [Treponema sp.]|nr:radical SAM protein [Treponema sp.]